MTVEEANSKGKRLLKLPCQQALIDSPDLDAALLLAGALSLRREELITRGGETIAENVYKSYQSALKRRRSGECVAYILGRKEFRGLEFAVNPHVLVPRPDTEILLEAALEHIDLLAESGINCPLVLDLCTGTGVLAVSLKKERGFIEITASDISREALKIAAANADRLLAKVRFAESDLFNAFSAKSSHGRFNVIVSNPPYVSSGELSSLPPEVQREPRLALDGGKDGLDCIRKIICGAREHLHPGGSLLLEAAPGQMPAIRALMRKNSFGGIKLYKDLAGRNRVISGKTGK